MGIVDQNMGTVQSGFGRGFTRLPGGEGRMQPISDAATISRPGATARIAPVNLADGVEPAELLAAAASVEQHSRHPVGGIGRHLLVWYPAQLVGPLGPPRLVIEAPEGFDPLTEEPRMILATGESQADLVAEMERFLEQRLLRE